jgi:chloride channel 2
MKAIMAGVNLPNMLSVKTYVSKVLGMIFMLSSGMSLGKEGPFVHIAGCIANSLPYKTLRTNKTLLHQFLTAAVAVGVTCTFGAPIGGVLFSIEVSATSFTVSNLWKSFFASTITVLCFKSVGLLASAAVFSADASYFYSGVAPVGINHEQPFFVGLGITCGILGTMYIQFQKKVNLWKKANMKYWFIQNNWIYTLTMTFLVSNAIYFTRIMQTGDKAIINSMINVDQTIAKLNVTSGSFVEYLEDNFKFGYEIMEDGDKWVLYQGYLIMYLLMKMLFTALTLSCPIPGGIFTPTFAMGAVIGQIYVNCVIAILGFFEMQDIV